jgi:hypothetical protein
LASTSASSVLGYAPIWRSTIKPVIMAPRTIAEPKIRPIRLRDIAGNVVFISPQKRKNISHILNEYKAAMHG